MSGDQKIVCRMRPWWPLAFAMLAGFGFALLMGWGISVACLVAVGVNVIAAFLPPRRFGRWTE